MSVLGQEIIPGKTDGDRWKYVPASDLFSAVYRGSPDASPLAIMNTWECNFGGGAVVRGAILGASSMVEVLVDGRGIVSIITSCGRGVELDIEPEWTSLSKRFDKERYGRALVAGGEPVAHRGEIGGVFYDMFLITLPWQEGKKLPRAPLAARCFGWDFGTDCAVKSEDRDRLIMSKDHPYTLTDVLPTERGCLVKNYHCYPGEGLVSDTVRFDYRCLSN